MVGLAVITVHKAALLDKLKKNREQHRSAFRAAHQGYLRQSIKELEAMLADAQHSRLTRRSIQAPRPEDHTDDYDRVIEMVEMSVADEIELTNQEFAQYVRDDWGWKQAFTTTASHYK